MLDLGNGKDDEVEPVDMVILPPPPYIDEITTETKTLKPVILKKIDIPSTSGWKITVD